VSFVAISAGAHPVICNVSGTSVTPTSGTNVFFVLPAVTNTDLSYELRFSTPQPQLSFTRSAVGANTSMVGWNASAYNMDGALLNSISQPAIFPGPPSAQFSLAGPGITRIRVDAFNSARRTFNHPPFDDFVITPARPSEYQVEFSTFIRGNSLIGPPQSRCGRGEQLYFAGDDRAPASMANSFRTRQIVTVITDAVADGDGLKDGTPPLNLVGVTKSYAPDALPTIDSSDDDFPDLDDCHLLHDMARAGNDGMSVSVVRTGVSSLAVHLSGSVGNPLVRGAGTIASIDWDLILTLESNGSTTAWTLTGTDDGFPSFELYVNGHPIYVRDVPPPYDAQTLRRLLPGVGDRTIALGGEL